MMEDMISTRSEWDSISAIDLSRPNPKALYFALLEAEPHESAQEQSQRFLYQQLNKVESMESDLPLKVEELMDWMR